MLRKVKVTWSLLAASSPASPFILLKLSGVPGTDAEGSALLGCHKIKKIIGGGILSIK